MHSPCADSSLPGLLVEKGIGHTLSPLDAKLLLIVSYRERERQFLQNAILGKLSTLRWKTTHPRIFQERKFVLLDLQKKKKGHQVG